MRVRISLGAEKQLRKLSKVNQIVVAQKIRTFKVRSAVADTKLKGYKNIFRVRVGDYRIVYRKTSLEVYIVLIGHRKDIYSLLNRLLG